ncbi:tripartite tricarboxylate transporter permease [Virgibacillus halodenitrificans]|uniref:Tripartite tricarboxylate transporter permease n=1 Tax=Virgibacillus halodenitrificans TaxID=1482 RepID=A0ABR7VKD6_VIRHA|nr:tripartite tricarboxylate transporter permease [Virgibacillus halodenitrificans]MBD1221238.1 tripartite tricarboxylate transporter permease [Virgibacillus halodenitrificans]
MSEIIEGLSFALSPLAILANLLGVALGITFGALPGLTATMGLALIVPLTFGIPPVVAFSALLGVYVGAVYAGSITATLIGTPGTAAAAATLLEGPALTAKGESKKALTMTTVSSFIGGIFSCIVLILISPQLAKVALSFGPPEYFALALFGISIVAGVSGDSLLKGVIAGLMGLFIATIGMDPVTGTNRFTFGLPELLNGIDIIPALVGLFAISEVLTRLEKRGRITSSDIKTSSIGLKLGEVGRNWFNLLRSSAIGTFIGIIPATGSGVAAFVAYNESKRASKEKEKYGKGNIDGLASTESANSAVTGGALVPLLTLGIPGDVITAVLLGALMIQGYTPGPTLFTSNGDIIYGIFAALIIANIFMLVLGLGASRLFPKLLKIPEEILMPIIVVFCVLGAYSISNSPFDVLVMLIFGLLGYTMLKVGLPLAPLLLALILAPIVERNFRRAMIISENAYSIFFTRPISLGILIITFLVFAGIIRNQYKKEKRGEDN